VSGTQRPRTRLDPEVRREQIVVAAERVLQGRDPGDVTFEEIAEEAGVSRALVYNYFGDKGGVIAAVYLRSLRRLDEELARTVDPASDDAERLRSVVHCYLRFAGESSTAWRLIGSTAAMEHPDVIAARRRRFDQIADNWGGTASARITARAVVGFLEAATLDWIDRGDVGLEGLADLLYTILWSGLSAVDDREAHVPRGETAATVIG
jgi:AcrR family transcriptional regulator